MWATKGLRVAEILSLEGTRNTSILLKVDPLSETANLRRKRLTCHEVPAIRVNARTAC